MVAVDTNVIIDQLNSRLGDTSLLKAIGLVALPAPVIGELLFGARNSGRVAQNLAKYRSFIFDLTVLPLDAPAAEHYAEIRLALKQKGRPIPENDMWIAAICRAHEVPLLTFDKHFAEIPDLRLVTL